MADPLDKKEKSEEISPREEERVEGQSPSYAVRKMKKLEGPVKRALDDLVFILWNDAAPSDHANALLRWKAKWL